MVTSDFFFFFRVLAAESSNETSEDCFYDFVARGDLWYNDSTRDLVGDLGGCLLSCASKSPILKHNLNKSARGGPLGSSNVR